MELSRPRFVVRDELFVRHPDRAGAVRFAGLWVAGPLGALARPAVAVVGSRAPSPAGAARARTLGAALARAGACVISGLALGVDGAAHAGALDGGGPTVGVLGGGHRRFFPRRNRELAERVVAAGGAVLSPYAPDEPARPGQFLQRNGVVAALADAVVIVEAAERSGALNTASWAADVGIDVLAYPGDVDRPIAAGCNALIRDGATLVRGPADVLDALGLHGRSGDGSDGSDGYDDGDGSDGSRRGRGAEGNRTVVRDDPATVALVAALRAGPCDVDTLAERTGIAPGTLVATVVRLEIEGRVARRDGTVALVVGDAPRRVVRARYGDDRLRSGGGVSAN